MPTYGEWRDDSVPFWVNIGQTDTRSGGVNWMADADAGPYPEESSPTHIAEVMNKVWTSAPVSGPNTNITYASLDVYSSSIGSTEWTYHASWTQNWIRLTHSPVTVTEGILPNHGEPNVIGVEWEPQEFPDEERGRITLGTPSQTLYSHAGHVITAKVDSDPWTYKRADAVAALPTLGTTVYGTYIDPIYFSLAAGETPWVGLIDPYTATQTPPTSQFPQPLRYPFTVRREGLYAPRYRLIYGTSATRHAPPLRLTQRGDGLTGAPRLLGNKTRQSTNRLLGGAF